MDEKYRMRNKKCNNNIFVSHPSDNSSDFNFTVIYSNVFPPGSMCYRISSRIKLRSTQYTLEDCFDINFIFNGIRYSNEDFRFSELNYHHWKPKYETKRKEIFNAHYYLIWYKNLKIGKFSTIEDNEIIGIYDYEIYPIFQGKGLGSKFLKMYCSTQKK